MMSCGTSAPDGYFILISARYVITPMPRFGQLLSNDKKKAETFTELIGCGLLRRIELLVALPDKDRIAD